MNDTLPHPLVRAFLSAVDERTRTLPDERRRELLADLGEHIEVTLAGSHPADETTVRGVLDRLGSPRTIADAALAEEGAGPLRPEAEGTARTAVTLTLLALFFPLAFVPLAGLVLTPVFLVVGLVRLWMSTQWARREQWLATVLLLSPVLTVTVFAGVLMVATSGLGPTALMAALALSWILPLVAVVRLARSAARLRSAL
ncbi:HAAS signaling domain-containing protein [Streptomyces sp. NPDC051555]|uniref:HAAS signaling domain-containing protein n=1 Tax=Streptomyces sp. NPDC051555 TaxID=3365657 RepID=UPI0037BE0C2C